MSSWGKNPAVIAMRENFTVCPGCGRERDRIYAERHHPEMTMNQCLTVEHRVSRSVGGTSVLSNLLIICHRCNFTRGNQEPWDWYGAEAGVYAEGWPVPKFWPGKKGRENRRLWEQRSLAIAALLGQGPFKELEVLCKSL